MAKKHSLDFTIEHDYYLIAIFSVLEDYRLAYFLNEILQIQLKREEYDFNFSKKDGDFSVFNFEDINTFNYWTLISNKQIFDIDVSNSPNLFQEISNTYVLIPEKKKVDYFIKIEGDFNSNEIQLLIKKINSIHQVITSYEIDPNTLKSKDFLIH